MLGWNLTDRISDARRNHTGTWLSCNSIWFKYVLDIFYSIFSEPGVPYYLVKKKKSTSHDGENRPQVPILGPCHPVYNCYRSCQDPGESRTSWSVLAWWGSHIRSYLQFSPLILQSVQFVLGANFLSEFFSDN